MHIGGPKRTKRLDDERPEVVGTTPDGLPIWIEQGDKALTPDDKANLSGKLKDKRHMAEVARAAKQVQEMAAGFLEASILEVAPEAVLVDYKALTTGEGDGKLFTDWMANSGFGFRQEGFKSCFLYKGKVVREITAKVDWKLATEVAAMLVSDSILAKGQEIKE